MASDPSSCITSIVVHLVSQSEDNDLDCLFLDKVNHLHLRLQRELAKSSTILHIMRMYCLMYVKLCVWKLCIVRDYNVEAA